MKKTIALVVATLSLSSFGFANAEWVNGYTKKDGTYVSGHSRSSPDDNRYNNYGSQSNGGSQRDEFSNGFGATNKGNSSYNWRDNDNDGYLNSYDRNPNRR